jgi:hypothetical protein
MAMKHPKPLHPANAEELAAIARETGAEVLRGALRYPSESGGWQLDGLDLSEHLDEYRGQDLVVIIASTGSTRAEQTVCGICGFVLNGAGECPRCRLAAKEAAEELQEWERAREALFREVEEILEQGAD